MSNPKHNQSNEIQELGEEVTKQWINDGQIVIFTSQKPARTAVDIWIENIKETIQQWPSEQLCCMVLNVSGKRNSLTPYALSRHLELVKFRPELQIRIASILPQTYFAKLFRLTAREYSKGNLQVRMFTDKTQGVDWLSSLV